MLSYLLKEERSTLQLLADSPRGIRAPGPPLTPATEEDYLAVYLKHLAILGLAERVFVCRYCPNGKCFCMSVTFFRQTYFRYTLTEQGRNAMRGPD